METWTWLVYGLFVAANAEEITFWLSILLGITVASMGALYMERKSLDEEGPIPVGYIAKAFKAFLGILSVWIVLAIALPTYNQMKILIGVESASRIAHSEDAKRIAGKTLSAFEKLIDKLNERK